MNTVIFRTVTPVLTALILLFSIYVALRGHNDPGGGFIGGLLGASGLAIYAIAFGVPAARKALIIHPITMAGFGVVMAGLSGLLSLIYDVPFLTSIWNIIPLDGVELALSTLMFFDIGVYCVVVGAVTTIALALEGEDD